MRIFSTVLKIKNTLTKEDFIRLMIEWNQNNQYEENVIPGLDWNGEKTFHAGSVALWLDVKEYAGKNIIAARFEKAESNGVIWDTDYVMNFDAMEIAIIMERSYSEDALMTGKEFSTPYFIKYLISGGYVEQDDGLPVGMEPVFINNANFGIFDKVLGGNTTYRLPIVYISKTADGQYPLDYKNLAYRLKGAAHILVEEALNDENKMKLQYEKNGNISIYYPGNKSNHVYFTYRNVPEIESILYSRVLKHVIQTALVQKTDALLTWQGVDNALLLERLNEQRKETDELCDMFDSEVKEYEKKEDELKDKMTRLMNEIEALHAENQGLRGRLNQLDREPLLLYGNETDFYPGEIKDLVLSALAEVCENELERKRRIDVFGDIIEANDYQKLSEQNQKKVRDLLKGTKDLSNSSQKQALRKMGIEIQEDRTHYIVTLSGDSRYMVTIAKTGSDVRGGRNNAANIIKTML